MWNVSTTIWHVNFYFNSILSSPKILGSSEGVFSPMHLSSLWRELVRPTLLPPSFPMGGKVTFPHKSWVHPQHLLPRLGSACLWGGCSIAPFWMATGPCPVWGVLCLPRCVRGGVTRGLSWQHTHISHGPHPHPSCKHQRGWYSVWVIATLWTLLFFLCVVTGIEKREVYL